METKTQKSERANFASQAKNYPGLLYYQYPDEKIKKSRYDLGPFAELIEDVISADELVAVLRDIHHRYASILLKELMESDNAGKAKDVNYDNDTLNNLFHLKLLADRIEEVDNTQIVIIEDYRDL
jgi:hypothetical protein